jgi:hypothetical protein
MREKAGEKNPSLVKEQASSQALQAVHRVNSRVRLSGSMVWLLSDRSIVDGRMAG